MRVVVCLAVLSCAACQSTPGAAPLFAHCPGVSPAPASGPYRIAAGAPLDTCADDTYPLIGLTFQSTRSSDAYGMAILSPNLAVHVQGDSGYSADFDSFKGVDPLGVAIEATGTIHLSFSAPRVLIEYPDSYSSWRYVLTNGPAPVDFFSP